MTTLPAAGQAARVIKASEFKAKCLALMDEVAATGEELVITKNGHPVARLCPLREKPQPPFGVDRELIKILGELESPINAEWEADTEDFGKGWS